MGEPPFYKTIKLLRGEPIIFRVLLPNGQPAPETQITAHSKADSVMGSDCEFGAFQENQKPAKSLVLMGTEPPRCVNEYPRQGSNNQSSTNEIVRQTDTSSNGGSTGGSIPAHLSTKTTEELLSIWAKLDEPARRDLLAAARGLAGK